MGDEADMFLGMWGDEFDSEYDSQGSEGGGYLHDSGSSVRKCRDCDARVLLVARSFARREFEVRSLDDNRKHYCKKLNPKTEFDDLTV